MPVRLHDGDLGPAAEPPLAPIVMGRSIGASAVSAASRASSRARSALPGAYPRTGSFTGVGTLVTASMKGNPP